MTKRKNILTLVGLLALIFASLVFQILKPDNVPTENDNIAIRFLNSGIEPTPTPIPEILENKTLKQEIQQIKLERDKLHQQLTSRGEIDRQKALKNQKVIDAIDNNLGGVFKGYAVFIYETCKKYDVNPMLFASIAKVETANGTSKLVKQANNPGGINWFKGCGYPKSGWYQKYPTLEVGIKEMARILKEVYIDQGHGDIVKIGRKYAPVDDSRNGIEGMDNNKWVMMVTEHYHKILKEAEL